MGSAHTKVLFSVCGVRRPRYLFPRYRFCCRLLSLSDGHNLIVYVLGHLVPTSHPRTRSP